MHALCWSVYLSSCVAFKISHISDHIPLWVYLIFPVDLLEHTNIHIYTHVHWSTISWLPNGVSSASACRLSEQGHPDRCVCLQEHSRSLSPGLIYQPFRETHTHNSVFSSVRYLWLCDDLLRNPIMLTNPNAAQQSQHIGYVHKYYRLLCIIKTVCIHKHNWPIHVVIENAAVPLKHTSWAIVSNNSTFLSVLLESVAQILSKSLISLSFQKLSLLYNLQWSTFYICDSYCSDYSRLLRSQSFKDSWFVLVIPHYFSCHV